jgi:hypothetical protein
LESSADLSKCFDEELNCAFSGKKHLLSFLDKLKENECFLDIKAPLTELQFESRFQLEKLESLYLLSNGKIPDWLSSSDHGLSKIEKLIIENQNSFIMKRNLLLLTYLKMAETKESVSVKKLKHLAIILKYTRTLFILNKSEDLVVNYKNFFNRIASTVLPKMAV